MAAELLAINGRSVQRHFARLQDAQLVYCMPYYPEDKERGAAPYAYGLSDSGVSKAFAEGFATDSTKSFRDHSAKTVEHELMISKFHLELARLAQTRGWTLRWRQRDLNTAVFKKNKGQKERVHVNPDALFSINGTYWYLEVERAKLGNYRNGEPQIIRKLHSYWKYFDSTDCEKDFGFRKFRVATVMRTPVRSQNLVGLLAAAGLDKATFLVSHEQDLFAFTTPKTGGAVSFDAILN